MGYAVMEWQSHLVATKWMTGAKCQLCHHPNCVMLLLQQVGATQYCYGMMVRQWLLVMTGLELVGIVRMGHVACQHCHQDCITLVNHKSCLPRNHQRLKKHRPKRWKCPCLLGLSCQDHCGKFHLRERGATEG